MIKERNRWRMSVLCCSYCNEMTIDEGKHSITWHNKGDMIATIPHDFMNREEAEIKTRAIAIPI